MNNIKTILTQYLCNSDFDRKLAFYERLGFNLTIAIRSIWSNADFTDKEKVDKIKLINELSHNVFNWMWRLRKNDKTFDDLDNLSDISNYIRQDKDVAIELAIAVSNTYRQLMQS